MTEPRLIRQVGMLGAAAVLLVLAWRVTTLGLADHYSVSDPARALAWRDQHPEALVREADRLALDPAQAGPAAEAARAALRANPLDGRGYRVLGSLAPDREKAATLHGLAAHRSPREVISHGWLIEHHMDLGNYEAALAHADLIFRVSPRLAGNLTPLMLGMAVTPEAQPALAEQLLMSPPWKQGTLRHIILNAPDTDAITPLMDRLRQTPGGLGNEALGLWLDRLTREDRWGQAYLTWVSQLPPERLQGLGNVFNGDFEWEPTHTGFDWRFGRVTGARISRLAIAGATDGMALRVAFSDRRVPFSHVRQQLALPPGRYRLSGKVRLESLRTDRGLVWTVGCAGPRNRPLVDTPPLRGQSPWKQFEAEFEVPREGCGGQWLTLRLPARIPAEQRIGGTVWFDEMRIARLRE